ncbi:putative sulfate exporter family transporter [Cupriavidus respiraculi]|uniref:YeiH family protein n=1 Tax=Cupriavidus respiraculi TaxID=195930 RepID=UPI001C980897|nr:putative sulfate exporter family transporter [Cupriavidus respiraculi]MBY4947066.1 putative sulfate exporter family transporter [Cupriavidus respiraculi]
MSTVPTTPTVAALPPTWTQRLLTVIPLGGVAWLASVLAAHPAISHLGISPLMLAMCAGMVACNTMPRHWLAPLGPGMQFARHHMLRVGVALYGLRLTFGSMAALGAAGVLVPLAMLVATLVVGTWIGTRWLGLTRREAIVVSAGSAVCGAAAAIAMASVVRTDDRQTAVAVATVVLFGTAGMFLYPYLFELATAQWHWAVSQRAFGIYTGATLHEVAQVIAAGKMIGDPAADAAVLAKMVRVLALGPLLLVMAMWPGIGEDADTRAGKHRGAAQAVPAASRSHLRSLLKSVPWFAVGFVAVMAINSAGLVPSSWQPGLVALDNWLLACAMLAIGLHTRIADLLRAGRKPLVLAALLFGFLMVAGALLCAATL